MNAKNEVYEYLAAQGLPLSVIVGISAQASRESSYRPALVEKAKIGKTGYTQEEYVKAVMDGSYPGWLTDRCGFGLFQWTHKDRKAGLKALADSCGLPITSVTVQMDYLMKELRSKQFRKVWEVICNATDDADGAYKVGYSMCYDFEKPAKKETSAPKRGQLARELYAEYEWRNRKR